MAWRLALGGALYALVEIGLGLTLGRFLEWGRAEALLFFAFRPWCLLGLAFAARGQGWTLRWALYAAGLALASLGEGLLTVALGASIPASELGRGLLGGLVLILIYEILIQGGKRLHLQFGAIAGALLALPFLTLPNGLAIYDALVLENPRADNGPKPGLMLLTGLPLQWGEWSKWYQEPLATSTYMHLAAEFDDIVWIDVVGEGVSDQGKLLLIAQPRRLAPAELVRLDTWVRGGGRALILTDPLLLWPSDMPLGDVRRGPPVGLLGPLLGHWGLRLEEAAEKGVAIRMKNGRKWTLAAPGRFSGTNPECRIMEDGLIADCRIGKGRALLVADADMLHDTLWTGPGENGASRHRRIADNPLLVADWLDDLAGLSRTRLAGEVAWRVPGDDPAMAVLLALLPALLAGVAGLALRQRRKS